MRDGNKIEHFAPGWFASVMSTAVIVVAIYVFRRLIPFAWEIQVFLLMLSCALLIVLLIPWTLRWIHYPQAVQRDLRHPIAAPFFSTLPISLVVSGIALEKTSLPFLPEETRWMVVLILWVVGALGIIGLALYLINVFFHQPEVKWEQSTFGWLIPPVSTLIVPILGNALTVHFAGQSLGATILLINLMFLGVGSVLFLLVMGMVFTRYVFYALPPVHLTPTLWVGLAPTSILTLVLLRLPAALEAVWTLDQVTVTLLNVVAQVVGIALWGFGVFWLLLALWVTLAIQRRERLPFALSWWAFVFPLGAFTVATGALYQNWSHPFFLGIGAISLVSLILIWAVTFIRTLQGAWRGTLFAPPMHRPEKASHQ